MRMPEKIELQENACYAAISSLKIREVVPQPKDVKLSKLIKLLTVVVAALTLLVIGACACIVAGYLEIRKLRSEIEILQEPSIATTTTEINNNTLQENVTQFCVDCQTLTSNITVLEENIKTSCANISSSSPSGYYYVRSSNGSAVVVYCDMTRSCSGIIGGWMRVADLDMRNSSVQCPSGLEEMTYSSDNNIRTCTQTSTDAGCSSDIDYPTYGIPYIHVCGMIRGYGLASPDAFENQFRPGNLTSADTNYVDGISLTHGMNHGQHIWTFGNANSRCCSSGRPDFVGNDFTCDQPSVLWDGVGCEPHNTPLFYRQLPQSTTDDIQMRVYRDESRRQEDTLVERIEIFIQ